MSQKERSEMENEDVKESRSKDLSDGRRKLQRPSVGDDSADEIKKGTPNKKPKYAPLDDEEDGDEEVIDEEEDTDPDEVMEYDVGLSASRRFLEASSVYDPKKREPQACELWRFEDADFNAKGRF